MKKELEVSPRLLTLLRKAGDEWGPLSVALAAAQLSDPQAVARQLTKPDGKTRPDWDTYFLNIAQAVAARADCRRGQYGCVLVDENHRIVSAGYNGGPVGGASCLAGDCPRGLLPRHEMPSFLDGNNDYTNCISSHAEMNAVALADHSRMRNATAYLNGPPCDTCNKLLRAAGVVRVVFP